MVRVVVVTNGVVFTGGGSVHERWWLWSQRGEGGDGPSLAIKEQNRCVNMLFDKKR